MKNLLYLLVTLSLFSCSEKRVTFDDLSETGGYFYYEGKKFTGTGFEMFNSTKVKHETHYKDGEKDGEEKYFNKNGDLTYLRTYINDELNGPFEEYYQTYDESFYKKYGLTKLDSVFIVKKGTYINGKLNGEIIDCLDCYGSVYDVVEKLYVKGNYTNGIRIGKFQYYTKSIPNWKTVTYDNYGKVIDGIEINGNNYWKEEFNDPRKIKK